MVLKGGKPLAVECGDTVALSWDELALYLAVGSRRGSRAVKLSPDQAEALAAKLGFVADVLREAARARG